MRRVKLNDRRVVGMGNVLGGIPSPAASGLTSLLPSNAAAPTVCGRKEGRSFGF